MFFIRILGVVFLCTISFLKPTVGPSGFRGFSNRYFVETGTYKGEGIDRARDAGFQEIYSIELDKKWAKKARKKFKHNQNVHIIHGDSSRVLGDVIKNINEPITFWLDGHNSSGKPGSKNTPLMEELEQIKQHNIKTHTILIDDMRYLGTWALDYIDKATLINKILEINPEYQITYIDGHCANDILVALVPPTH